MNPDLVSKFKLKYESLAGIVHLVKNEAAAAGVVLGILKEAQGRRVALGALPEPLLKPIDSACAAAGIAVLKPPFDNRELPHAIDAAQVGVSWAAVAVAEHSHEFFKLVELIEDEVPAAAQTLLKGRTYGFHIACHQRALGAGSHAIDFLKRRGAEIEVVETGTCCGMAGTFGLKKGFLGYALSQAVGEPLFEEFKNADVEAIVTESSVCSIHLREGTGMQVRHPLELLPT